MTDAPIGRPSPPTTVLCVVGTRPDVIKMAPVIWALRTHPDWCRLRVCVTGQHRDMLGPLLTLFGIRPDHDLDLMQENQSLPALTSRLFSALGQAMATERPDWVVVQGDTTTAFVAGMAAFYAGARVAHVEAGLRTSDRRRPFPEEMNRRLLGQVADLHLAPTAAAREHLRAAGVDAEAIVVTGNTAIDALRWTAKQPPGPEWDALPLASGARLVLVTTHRRESFGSPLEETCAAIVELARAYAGDLQILLPVHPNPNVREPVERRLGGEPNVLLTPPLAYPTVVHAMRRAHFVLTDSGGIQEEAPSLGCPVLVLRESTERPEGVAAGVAKLVGTDRQTIVREARRLLDDPAAHAAMARPVDVYGDGHAGPRIADAIRAYDSDRTASGPGRT